MRIDTVTHTLPRHEITADWIVQKLRRVNHAHLSAQQLDDMERTVVGFLDAAGSDVKYQATNGELAIDLAIAAGKRALSKVDWEPSSIDLLIYASVARGTLEPATANVVQARLGLSRATCFDVLDGCATWLRALELTHSLMAAGRYRRAMIVTCEAGLEAFGRWEFGSPHELLDYLATFTIGEAATATLVSATETDDFYARFANFGEHAGLCMIPLVSVDHFGVPANGRHTNRFFAQSRELLAETTARILELYRSDRKFTEGVYDVGFGHAASERAVDVIRRELGIDRDVYFPTHAKYGNTVSSSVPLGMSLALEEGRLQRNHKVLVVVGASGISVGIASFTF